jgi:hypothetical protein
VHSGHLDERSDLRLGAAEQHGPAADAEPAREHRQIQHQRPIREGEL